jgi:hypothetical protein
MGVKMVKKNMVEQQELLINFIKNLNNGLLMNDIKNKKII